MIELLPVLFPILVVDVLNPVLLGLLIFAAGSRKAFANSASLLLGHTVAYFFVGIAVSYGVEQVSEFIADRMQNPKSIDFVIGLILGVICLYYAFKPAAKPDQQKEPDWELTPAKCFAYGGIVNFIGVPFAVPYFAAVDQILKADLTFWTSITTLGIYNIGYMLIFAIVPVAVLFMGERSRPMLARLNERMVSFTTKSMPWFLGLLGTYLVLDAAYFFATGKAMV